MVKLAPFFTERKGSDHWSWSIHSCGIRFWAVQSTVGQMPTHDRVWIATQFFADIQTYFGHFRALHDLDMEKEFQAYIDQIVASDHRRTFDLATTALPAKLQNGHSWLRRQMDIREHWPTAWILCLSCRRCVGRRGE
ncbi:MAG TPA: hypothetical protein VI756_25990 [Blastocatellia bacterium]